MSQLTEDIKRLRLATGAGFLECKAALEKHHNVYILAFNELKAESINKGRRKIQAQRSVNEGIVEIFKDENNKLATMVELRCETDFVARTETVRLLASQLAEHIAIFRPDSIEAMLQQPFLSSEISVEEALTEAAAATGEKLQLARFTFFEI